MCRDFCDLNGLLCPRRVNRNRNITFTPATDSNTPTDEMFLDSFLRQSARNASKGLRVAGDISSTPIGEAFSMAGLYLDP